MMKVFDETDLTDLEKRAGIRICPEHGKYINGRGCEFCISRAKWRVKIAKENVLLALGELSNAERKFSYLGWGKCTDKLIKKLEKEYEIKLADIGEVVIVEEPSTEIKFKKQDQWIGRYYDDKYNYICLIPCLPIMIPRRKKK